MVRRQQRNSGCERENGGSFRQQDWRGTARSIDYGWLMGDPDMDTGQSKMEILSFLQLDSFVTEWFSGLLGAFGAGLMVLVGKMARLSYLNYKYPVGGDYLTFYQDVCNGEKITYSAPATIKQKGLRFKGNTELEEGKSWSIEGSVREGGHVYGTYFADSLHDQGMGNFFLKISANRDMEGIWAGYDHENKIVTSGEYRFYHIPKIKIRPANSSDHSRILDISSSVLGDGYLPDMHSLESAKNCIFLVAVLNGKIVGFSYARILQHGDVKQIIRSSRDIPPDVSLSEQRGKLGYLHTVGVDPKFQRRNIGTALVRESIEQLKKLGAETLLSVGWKSEKGVHIGGVLKRSNLNAFKEIAEYWLEDSKKKGYSCPSCGNPCRCSAVLFKSSLF